MTTTYHFAYGFIAAAALATGGIASAQAATPLSANTHFIRLGYTATHFDRHEHSLDSQKGWLNGLDLEGLYIGHYLYFDSGLNYSAGSATYDGGIQYFDPGTGNLRSTPYSTSIDEKVLTSHLDIGPVFHFMGKRDALSPFVGFETRYHYDHTGSSQVTVPTSSGPQTSMLPATTNKRFQAQARFGAMDRFAVTSKLGIELKALATYNVYGHLQNRITSGDYKGHDWGYIGSATADYQLTHWFGAYARASYAKVKTSRIDLSQAYYEPSASSGVTRLTIGAQARF